MPDISSHEAGSYRPTVLVVGAFLSESTGIRFVCEDLAAGLSSRGWSVTTTSHLRSRLPRLLDMLATTWLKRGAYTVAQMDVYSGAAFIWAEAVAASLRMLRCPYVITLHSGAFPEFAERRPRRVHRLLQSAAVVTSPSPFLAEQLKRFRSDIQIVHNGLDMSLYPARTIGQARPRLVWIRAFEQRYNPVMALETVRRLMEEFPDVELLMAGPNRTDWSAERTVEEARRLGVHERVRVIGAIPKTEVPIVLQEGDIFLNTTNVDNAPVTVVEAMACGLCVVSTDAGGVPYLVEDGKHALLVPRGDPGAMAAAVRRILVEPNLAESLSENARRSAETFDWNRVLPQWELLLAEVARERHAKP